MIAKSEFESWFLAAASRSQTRASCRLTFDGRVTLRGTRGAKEKISEAMKEARGHSYRRRRLMKEHVRQSTFDLDEARIALRRSTS